MRTAMARTTVEAGVSGQSVGKVIPISRNSELSEEYLTRRFVRPAKEPAQVVYELTDDPGYLHQYYRLREQMFISVWGLKEFSGLKDEYDDESDIMVARVGNQVIGGCRLTFSTPNDRKHLPMEKQDFILEEQFPELPLYDLKFAEISRMAILPEYQNSIVMLELSRQLLKRGAEKKARFAFTLAPVPLARNYRKAAHLFGLNWKIRNDIAIPDREEYEGIKMVVSMLDLAPVYRPIPKDKKAKADNSISLVGA